MARAPLTRELPQNELIRRAERLGEEIRQAAETSGDEVKRSRELVERARRQSECGRALCLGFGVEGRADEPGTASEPRPARGGSRDRSR